MAQVERLVRVKAYKPPSNVESEIKILCKETFGKDFNEKTYQGLSFSNPLRKFQVLSRCVGIFKHNIPNTTLNEIKTVKDLIDYYMIEQKDTSTLEDLKNSEHLPKNLHINLEYTRFEPEKDKFFNGRDAYQNRDTKVTSLWYSKKYKEVKKEKKLFEK
jgi:large subunit ribosomal protein L50